MEQTIDVKANFEAFKNRLDAAELFRFDNLELKITDDGGLVTIPLKDQQLVDDFIEEIVKYIELKVLYAYEDEEGQHYKVVTYSRPFADEMFILFVESHEYGLIDDVQVIFYESIDRMFIELGRSLASMKRKKLEVLEEHELEEVARDFIW